MSIETAKLTFQQEHALHFVEHYRTNPGPNLWRHLHPHVLAHQLKMRVRDPDLINQRQSSWCGPAATVCSLASDSPDTYVKMVIDLVRHGRASLHHGKHAGATLHADHELMHFAFPWTKIDSADWVPLATIREGLKPSSHFQKTLISQGTFPADVVRFYHDLGYEEVHDLTSDTSLSGHHASTFAHNASEFVTRKYRATLRIHSDMLSTGTQDRHSGHHNHWVDLLSPIHATGQAPGSDPSVSFKVFSWGRTIHVPQQGTLSLKSFSNNFYGFVAAKY